MKKWAPLYITITLFLSSNIVHAEQNNDDFRFALTPYLWAASLKGTVATDGDTSPPIDSDYNFFSLDNVDGVASATFTARKNNWGILFDYLYVAYEDVFFASTVAQITPRLEGTVIELTGTYSPAQINNFEIIAGLRQQDITVSLAVLNKTPKQTVTWIDPLVGIIYTYNMSTDFDVILRGDLGGFGIESDLATNAEVTLRYQMNDIFDLKLGYRYLKVKFDDKDFIYDISLNGFLFGLTANF